MSFSRTVPRFAFPELLIQRRSRDRVRGVQIHLPTDTDQSAVRALIEAPEIAAKITLFPSFMYRHKK